MSKIQVVNELHRSARKNFERRRTDMIGINDTYQIDLVEMIPYASENRNFKYILTVIDIFSKYAWAIPIKTKNKTDVTNGMLSILKSGSIPKNIHSDMGTEFYNSVFQNVMKKYQINHYSTFSVMKASIVERFNRTLKTKMWKKLHFQGSYKWVNILHEIVDNYNNSKHSTIRMKPIDVKRSDENRLLSTVYNYKNSMHKPKFQLGDSVRISKFKSIFSKGYTPNWTSEIFRVFEIKYTQPVTYFIKDYQGNEIKGGFYGYELQKAMHPDVYLVERIIRSKGSKIYVKWLGFDQTHNSWIDRLDLVD